jgi:UDP-glucose 4-epimerase
VLQNTGNVVKILDAMRIHNVNKFIFSSTCATYGDHDEMPTTEDTGQVLSQPVCMISFVSVGKLAIFSCM